MDVYEALADPTRREIVGMLAVGERSAGDIADRFPIAGPSVSRHLKVLRESGLVTYRRDTTSRIYRLESEPLEEVRRWMHAQIELVRERLDRLGAHLDNMKEADEREGG